MPHIKRALPNRKRRTDPSAPPAPTDARLGRVARILMDYPTVVVSGTKLAQEIGTTRSEVWRLVQQLRALDVDIAGHSATGYSLKAVPDLLLPDILAPLLAGTLFGTNLRHYFKIGSTNTAAMQQAAEGAPEGTVFVAEQQSAGRGRGSHHWHSEHTAGIYCSVILRPAFPPSEALVLSLAVALAVHSAVRSIDPRLPVDLKWPNDLLLQGKKFCGILTEMNAESTRVRYLVIGIGLNVNHQKLPPELANRASSLRLETGREWSRVDLCAALLKSLDREYRQLCERPEAREVVLRRFQELSSSIRDRPASIEENGNTFEGVTDGLDSRGFLRLKTPSGPRVVLSGTVRLH